MNLAVLTYEFVTDKPAGIPNEWPAEVRELGESTELPGENWVLMTVQQLHDYQDLHRNSYNQWENSYFAPKPEEIINKAITKAEMFGKSLIEEFKIGNVALGITQANKTKQVADYCHRLEHYLGTGSLYAAITEINTMLEDPAFSQLGLSPFITVERLADYKARIQAYLGI
ncbi:MAG: hypothetical protein QXL01_00405 [Thermoplasmatales archaeon]